MADIQANPGKYDVVPSQDIFKARRRPVSLSSGGAATAPASPFDMGAPGCSVHQQRWRTVAVSQSAGRAVFSTSRCAVRRRAVKRCAASRAQRTATRSLRCRAETGQGPEFLRHQRERRGRRPGRDGGQRQNSNWWPAGDAQPRRKNQHRFTAEPDVCLGSWHGTRQVGAEGFPHGGQSRQSDARAWPEDHRHGQQEPHRGRPGRQSQAHGPGGSRSAQFAQSAIWRGQTRRLRDHRRADPEQADKPIRRWRESIAAWSCSIPISTAFRP